MSKKDKIKWLPLPEEHDYSASVSYLSIIYDIEKSKNLSEKLKNIPISYFKAKDIFRASWLSLLWISNSHVEKDIKKIDSDTSLSPILLIRDSVNWKVIIADWYHRLCAVYRFDEDSVIPCKIVSQ